MSLQIYNTLTRQKEEFKPLEEGKVKMYCCGPTVYDYLHIGNFRGAVFFNFVSLWLEHLGYDVTFVYNFTDVDDKILKRANDENTTPKKIAETYIEEFKKDFAQLKLRPHDHNPRVTEYMDEIIQYIKKLIANGKAYEADGDVYYSVSSFPEYGKLSNRKVEDLMSGVRIEVDPKKKEAADFTLWKPAKFGEQSWPSPWGKGRPGWHIECSCMSHSILGDELDIHGGGSDLVFPHHENEIAQSEGATGKQYARYWMHNNMINFSGAKMSKSLGNIRTMRSFLEEYHGEIFKYLIMSSHYRSESDFSENTIANAISGLARFYSALRLATNTMEGAPENHKSPVVEDFEKLINKAKENITEAFNDDFNTPKAFAELFEVIRQFNHHVKPTGKRTADMKVISVKMFGFIREIGALMSLFQEPPQKFLKSLDRILLRQKNLDEDKIDRVVKQRNEARKNKNFELADELRKRLTEMGIEVHDATGESSWEVIK